MRSGAIMLAAALLLPGIGRADLQQAALSVHRIDVATADGEISAGSAVLVAPGTLVTSCHAVRDALRVFVLHPQGQLRALPGTTSPRHDLCVLAVPELRGPVARRLPSAAMRVGQEVFAVWFETGSAPSVEERRITARHPMDGARMLRISAPFPTEATGGGLFADSGHLVGILTMRSTASGQLKFAAPMEWVERLLPPDILVAEARGRRSGPRSRSAHSM
jgi:S1-C subfamily serine protease